MKLLIGIDEVGRGAWAGPLVVGAVVLEREIAGLKDSKLLSRLARVRIAKEIYDEAVYIALGWASASEIDDMGLTQSTTLACERALLNAPKNIPIIIDGKYNYLPNLTNSATLVNGDKLIPGISAASIVAKVGRDKYMYEQASIYPGYGFDTNVGYGTKLHLDSIQQQGLTPLHRLSYKPIRNVLNKYEA